MSTLQISLFGSVQLSHDGWLSAVKMTRTMQILLAYLLLHRERPQPREVVAGQLWGEHSDEQARGCLSTALFRLRSILEPEGTPRGTYLLTSASGDISFNCQSDFWLDVAVFDDAARLAFSNPLESLDKAILHEIEQNLGIYSGEFMEGFYEDWVVRERERIHNLFVDALMRLMRYYARRGDYEKALLYGSKILNQEPIREEIHREMMRFYRESGQRALAIRQYQVCCKILQSELGIEPMMETQALFQHIAATQENESSPAIGTQPLVLEQTLEQLYVAKKAFEGAQQQLRRAIRLTEQFVEQCHR